jgi:AcrR family transcriptional regulator
MAGHAVERRRGKALEAAVLDAACGELLDLGYARFTIEGVAARAHTSRPVLYRRWPNRAELAIAAIRHIMDRHPMALPDTGRVRDDLIALLQQFSESRALFAGFFSLQMSDYFAETHTSLADLRARVLQGHHSLLDLVLGRGIDRGEIDPGRLTPRIASLPVDLLRHEVMMTLKPVPDAVIVELVDRIFLPLVRPEPAGEPEPARADQAGEPRRR